MNFRYFIGVATLGLLVAGSQAKAAFVTTDLGSISPGIFYDVISVDHTGILNYAGSNAPATLIQSNTIGDHGYLGAPSSAEFDFTFSVKNSSILNATATANTPFGGEASVYIYKGTTNLGSNLENIVLDAGTQYKLAVMGSSDGQGLYVLKGDVSPVPLPAALPLFASVVVGVAGFARSKRRNGVA